MNFTAKIKALFAWIAKTILVLTAGAVAGLLMLLVVYKLGTGMIYSHILESLPILEKEGNSYDIGGIEAYITDSFDDAYFLNQAMVGDEHGLLKTALNGYAFAPRGVDSPAEALTECLKSGIDSPDLTVGAPLVRFWCGYLVPLKLLLKFLTLSQVRMLNLYLQPLIVIMMILLMIRKGLGRYVFAVFLPYLLLGPVSMELCLAYAGYFYCTFIPCVLLLLYYEKLRGKWIWLFFQITGMAAIYLNINFFQLISFAFPFVLLCLMDKRAGTGRETTIPEGIRKFAVCFTNWFVGFAGMMIMKWIAYAILVDRAILTDMYNKIVFRSGSADEAGNAISRWDAVMKNIGFILSMRSWIMVEIIFIILCIILSIKYKSGKPSVKTIPLSVFMVALTIVLIIFRYALFPNHVWTHEWVMYRLCAIPVLVFNVCLIYNLFTSSL